MKKLLFLTFFLTCLLQAGAQELTLKEFRADPTDISAVKFEVKDLGGDPCALIKVGLVITDAVFEGDVVKSEYHEGEWWVYMVDGSNWLNIKTRRYPPLRCEFAPLEMKSVYLMAIEIPAGAKVPTGRMTISGNVRDADTYVDGEKVSSILPFTYEGPEGEHQVEVRKSGYNSEKRVINIQLNRKGSIEINLSPDGTFTLDGISYEMVRIPGGQFKMGSEKKVKTGGFNYAQPAHTVTLRTFQIGKTEVSQALWVAVMGSNPSVNQGPDLPVENVSWYDAMEFIEKLNARCGTHFRLPTEAEWEYAARSCGQTAPDDLSANGPVDKYANRGNTTVSVGGRLPNIVGLVNMSGNVAEWCSDWLSKYTPGSQLNPTGPANGIQKVYRGGGFSDDISQMECAARGHAKPDTISPTIGFRLALDD